MGIDIGFLVIFLFGAILSASLIDCGCYGYAFDRFLMATISVLMCLKTWKHWVYMKKKYRWGK